MVGTGGLLVSSLLDANHHQSINLTTICDDEKVRKKEERAENNSTNKIVKKR